MYGMYCKPQIYFSVSLASCLTVYSVFKQILFCDFTEKFLTWRSYRAQHFLFQADNGVHCCSSAFNMQCMLLYLAVGLSIMSIQEAEHQPTKKSTQQADNPSANFKAAA